MPKEKKAPTSKGKGRATAPELGGDVLEFMRAIDDFKRKNNKPFPTWSEVLQIVKDLGYVKPN